MFVGEIDYSLFEELISIYRATIYIAKMLMIDFRAEMDQSLTWAKEYLFCLMNKIVIFLIIYRGER